MRASVFFFLYGWEAGERERSANETALSSVIFRDQARFCLLVFVRDHLTLYSIIFLKIFIFIFIFIFLDLN